MRVTKHAVLAAGLTGAVLVGWLVPREPAPRARWAPHTESRAVVADDDSRVLPAATTAARGEDIAAPAAPLVAESWGALLRESDDYWTFAEKAHEAAKRGDAAAMWYLGVAINECTFVYERYFLNDLPEGGTYQRTVDEAHVFVMTKMARPEATSTDELTLLKKRCQRMSEGSTPPFGYGTDWTHDAAEAGFPLAQAREALIKAQWVLYDDTEDSRIAGRADARTLAIDALRTRDPEVIQKIAEVAAALTSQNEVEAHRRQLSWLLAACLRSPNCESLGDQMKLRCKFDPQCQPYETPLDILRRDAGNDFGEVERRARELNEKIDAGMIEESDI